MATVKIKLDHAGMRELMTADFVKAELQRRAEAIAEAAGEGFAVSSTSGHNRALAMVWAATPAAQRAEAQKQDKQGAKMGDERQLISLADLRAVLRERGMAL